MSIVAVETDMVLLDVSLLLPDVVLLDVESNVLLLDVSLLDMLELEIELDGMSLLQH